MLFYEYQICPKKSITAMSIHSLLTLVVHNNNNEFKNGVRVDLQQENKTKTFCLVS